MTKGIEPMSDAEREVLISTSDDVPGRPLTGIVNLARLERGQAGAKGHGVEDMIAGTP